jgi:SEC-C motif
VDTSWVELHRIVEEKAAADDTFRRQLEKIGRPLRPHAKRMSDAELQAKLREFGVDADRQALEKLCDGAVSVQDVASGVLDRFGEYSGVQKDWAWLSLLTLWERWWPDRPCLELLDDKMQAGYEADQRGDETTCVRAWLATWSDVLRLCDATGITSIADFDDQFPMTQYVGNWCGDFDIALQNAAVRDPALHGTRCEVSAEWLRRCTLDDDLNVKYFRRALAESTSEAGRETEADAMFGQWLADEPSWGWGWIGWADCYTPFKSEREKDYPRAESILLRGLAVPDVEERADIADRLADICEETGRPDEARDLRRQARQYDMPYVTGGVVREPATAAAQTAIAGPKIPRNAPCPCGSGKKFKKCCGAPGQR